MKIDITTPIEIDSFNSGMREPEGYGAFSGNQDEVDYPRRLQLDKIDNIEVDQVDMDDYPDFCDAFVVSADMNGIEMNEEELDELNENRGFVYEKLIDKLF
jgi:hypothetical protein